MVESIREIVEAPEEYTKVPPKPKGPQPDVEEFTKNPVQYSADRGVRNFRRYRIVPTRIQEHGVAGAFVERYVDILRDVKLNGARSYEGHGINARKRVRHDD